MSDADRNVPWVPSDDPRVAEREVEQVRAELADTVEELAHRLDVPARLRDKRDATTRRVQEQVAHAREVLAPVLSRALQERPGLVVAVVLAVVSLLASRLRRRTHREDEDGTR